MALIVQRTLHSLDAAPTLADLSSLPPFSRRRLSGDAAKPYGGGVVFAVGAAGPGQVVFQPDIHDPTQPLEDVTRIKILAIGANI